MIIPIMTNKLFQRSKFPHSYLRTYLVGHAIASNSKFIISRRVGTTKVITSIVNTKVIRVYVTSKHRINA